MEEGSHLTSSCCTEGMPKSDCTSIRVQLLCRNAKLLDTHYGLCCKCLVYLENINVVHLHTRSIQGKRDRLGGANAHHIWIHAANLRPPEHAQRLYAKLVSLRSPHQKH